MVVTCFIGSIGDVDIELDMLGKFRHHLVLLLVGIGRLYPERKSPDICIERIPCPFVDIIIIYTYW